MACLVAGFLLGGVVGFRLAREEHAEQLKKMGEILDFANESPHNRQFVLDELDRDLKAKGTGT